ncbi:hypothetical protein Fcan01_06261 [Folsomia candida]|uniref:Uncharacterized protein n=1 Tax=Folsomia candida TaxID=158441 RepID=A0A226ERK0_FOLCA|nr:hypothetical protein Fcan01_06261 [Folsomia candida]
MAVRAGEVCELTTCGCCFLSSLSLTKLMSPNVSFLVLWLGVMTTTISVGLLVIFYRLNCLPCCKREYPPQRTATVTNSEPNNIGVDSRVIYRTAEADFRQHLHLQSVILSPGRNQANVTIV